MARRQGFTHFHGEPFFRSGGLERLTGSKQEVAYYLGHCNCNGESQVHSCFLLCPNLILRAHLLLRCLWLFVCFVFSFPPELFKRPPVLALRNWNLNAKKNGCVVRCVSRACHHFPSLRPLCFPPVKLEWHPRFSIKVLLLLK